MDNISERYIVIDIETLGLRSVESKITCICAKDNEDIWFRFASTDEELIISTFLDWLNKKEIDLLVSANGKDFDIPFLLIRAYINGIPFARCSGLFCKKHFDIINDVTSSRISLDNLARLFGFELKTGNGFKAIQLYKEGKYSELVNYCANDVLLTEKVYLKLKEMRK